MTQNILGMSPTAYQQMLFRRVFMCVCSILFTLCLNLFFLSFFDKWNRQLLFFLNVVTDILCGCALIAYVELRILPQQKLLRLTKHRFSTYYGTVQSVSGVSIRYMDLECLEVQVDVRRLYIPVGTILLTSGNTYRFHLVSHIITEVET